MYIKYIQEEYNDIGQTYSLVSFGLGYLFSHHKSVHVFVRQEQEKRRWRTNSEMEHTVCVCERKISLVVGLSVEADYKAISQGFVSLC